MAVGTSTAAVAAHNGSAVLGMIASIPSTAMLAVLVSLPWWQVLAGDVSAIAVAVGQVLAVLIALGKLYQLLSDSRATTGDKARGAQDATGALASAAGGVAGASARAAGGVLATLGVLAALMLMFKPREAEARPAAPAVQSSTKRSRARDDAGGETGANAPPPSGDEPAWLGSARQQIGLREWKGKRHNPAVLQLYADAGHPEIDNDEVAWCAAFVGAHLERCGEPSSKMLNARSYLKWGAECDPKPGAIVVLWRNSPSSWEGHVGFYVGTDAKGRVGVLGGNQGDAVSIEWFAPSRVLGYRWPRSTLKTAVAGGITAAGGSVVVAAQAVKELEPLQAPLQQIGAGWAISTAGWIALGCAVVTVLGGLYVFWQRRKDHRERGQ